jgi:NADH:ubiquinone oxidoreductase subunit E
MKNAINEYHLESEITLVGSFCIGKCNRVGVTIQVDDDIITGITKDTFSAFFQEHILNKFVNERGR